MNPKLREGPLIGRTVAESEEFWPPRVVAPDNAPSFIQILLDDVGFAQFGCFGASIETPNIDRLAQDGLRYTNFHTTALCSPTRAALLTGRNPHSVGFGHVTERINGYPGYSMQLPDSAATIAEVLKENGYSTFAIGKWHLTPSFECGPQGPFDRWPLGRGFQRFYGFMGGCTDQYAPELVRDNTPAPSPSQAYYHLSEDLVDEAIRQISDHTSLAPHRPFYLHLAFGAGHAPHQVPSKWIEKYKGAFDHGWDVERQRTLDRQIESGVMPPATQLGPRNPGVQEWDSLSVDDQQLYARMMEVYAGFISHTDAQVGRLLDAVEQLEISSNTLVMLCSDNGASGEGGPEGSVDEGLQRYGKPQRAADARSHIDDLGGPKLFNHYPWGWAQAGNTPFPWYKQFTHAGGINNGLLVRWPEGKVAAGELRHQYHHVIDVVPTLLEAAGITAPKHVKGVAQQPTHGVSMAYSFSEPDAPGRRRSQHYEMWGNRGFWQDGWMAICRLQPDGAGSSPPAPMRAPFPDLPWELYNHVEDPSERNDLADAEPDRLRSMVDLWWAAAGQYQVLPVDDRPRVKRWPSHLPLPLGADPIKTRFFGSSGPHERGAAPRIAGSSFHIVAELAAEDSVEGVIYAQGGIHGGYCWYLQSGYVHLEVATSSIHTDTVSSELSLTPGQHVLELVVERTADGAGKIGFIADGSSLGGGNVPQLLKGMPITSGRAYVGYSEVPTVSAAFAPPFPLRGQLHHVTVNVESPNTTDDASVVELREQ